MFWQFRRELTEKLCKDNQVYLSVPFGDHVDDLRLLGCTLVNTKVSRRSINPFNDLKLWKFYDCLIRKIRPDKVITYSIKPNIYAGFVCSKHGIPYYTNIQGLGTAFQRPLLTVLVQLLYRLSLKRAYAVFFENESNASYFRERKIVPSERICVLPGAGVNLNYFCHQKYPRNKVPHFLFLGRIMKEKGVEELFYSIRRLKSEGISCHLDLVGFFENEYKTRVEELEKMGIVTYYGFQKDPRPFYKNTDCVVLPSYHEGMSNVLLEAAATGRPVITSDIPGCREAVQNNTTGILVPVKDSYALYVAMKEMLTRTLEERTTMGLLARQFVTDSYAKDIVVKKTLCEIFK